MMLDVRAHTIRPPHATFILVLIAFAQTSPDECAHRVVSLHTLTPPYLAPISSQFSPHS
jgi:hypothetical protein